MLVTPPSTRSKFYSAFNELALLLAVPHAARLLGISRAAAYRPVASGELPVRRRWPRLRRDSRPPGPGVMKGFVQQRGSRWFSGGRVKRDNDTVMFRYWSERTEAGDAPTPREVSEACKTSIHAARGRSSLLVGHSAEAGPTRVGTKDRSERPRLPAPRPGRRGRLEVPRRQSSGDVPNQSRRIVSFANVPKSVPKPNETAPGVFSGGRSYW
ncbi:MAG: integrase [Mycobacterium sp.]|nr:integrase [Mycobacterium sp.]